MKRTFFYDQITGEFNELSTYDTIYQAKALSAKIQKATGRYDDDFVTDIAEAIVNTKSLEFDWHEEAPETYRNFETFWHMVQKGTAPEEYYMYLVRHVNAHMVTMWRREYTKAWELWRPPAERIDASLTEEELNDPKENENETNS